MRHCQHIFAWQIVLQTGFSKEQMQLNVSISQGFSKGVQEH